MGTGWAAVAVALVLVAMGTPVAQAGAVPVDRADRSDAFRPEPIDVGDHPDDGAQTIDAGGHIDDGTHAIDHGADLRLDFSTPLAPAVYEAGDGDDDRPCPEGPVATDVPTDEGEPSADRPRIVELAPNPVTEGNVGEYFVLEIPQGATAENWSVTDGHATAELPDVDRSGRVAVSMDPNETRSLTAYPVVELDGHLKLAADGDELAILEDDGTHDDESDDDGIHEATIDRVAYDRAPLGEVWYRSDGASDDVRSSSAGEGVASGVWWPRGATCLEPTAATGSEATAFVLPDSPTVPIDELATADDRLLLAGYTFTSEAVADELLAAIDRGVDVEVLVAGDPVGGMPAETGPILDDLDDAGATVRVIGGRGSRYAHHHPKYVVVDDRAIVTTENWKPSGVGGAGSRGWGVIVEDPPVAIELARIFAIDTGGRDATAWRAYRSNATFVDVDAADGEFAERSASETVTVDRVELLVAPDNAEQRLLELVASAEESILIQQVRIGDPNVPLLRAAIDAARRGVDVKLLLDATWYVEAENRAMVSELDRLSEDEELPFEARLVEPDGRFEKIHAKGLVVDEEVAVVGSANWNNASFRENREVLIVLHGAEAGEYYAAVFENDWGDRSEPLPVGLVGVLLVALLAGAIVGRRSIGFGRDRRG